MSQPEVSDSTVSTVTLCHIRRNGREKKKKNVMTSFSDKTMAMLAGRSSEKWLDLVCFVGGRWEKRYSIYWKNGSDECY